MRASQVFLLLLALLGAGWTLPDSRASNFTWSVGNDVPVPLFNTEDADAGVVQDGATLYVQTSLYPDWYRYKGTTLDNLVVQMPNAVRDATFTTKPALTLPKKDDAFWTDGIWEDPSTGIRYAIIHVEYDYLDDPHVAFRWKRRIGLATSSDQGATWSYAGDIVTPNLSRPGAPTISPTGSSAPAGSYQDFGCGDTYLFVDRRTGYFYLYYLTAWVYTSTGYRTNEVMSVARCALSDKMAAGKWFKWSGGTWTQAGLGGAEDPVFPSSLGTSGSLFTGTDMTVVHFNSYLNEYVAIGHDAVLPSWISSCSDLTLQNWQAQDYTFPQAFTPPGRLSWYNWPVDPVTNDPYEIGQTFRLYSAQADYGGVGTKYFTVSFSNGNIAPTASLTSPTESAISFTSSPLNLVAAAADSDGSVAKVEFFANQGLIGTVATPPYVFTWPNVATGQYRLFVRATDNTGASTDSAGVDVTVTPITYPLWKAANGIPATTSDSAPQSNGLSPLVSYSLNLNSVAGLPQAQVSSGNLTLTYTPLRSDITYSVERSTDLINWTTTNVNEGTPSPTAVTASTPIAPAKQVFLHLRVTYQ